jgi:hypothetical protein
MCCSKLTFWWVRTSLQGVPDTGSPRSPAITGVNWAIAGGQLPQAGDPPSTSYRISRHDLENFLFQKMVRIPGSSC